MPTYHKIYVDSRRRISGHSADFVYQLAWPIDVPQSRVFVDSVQIPNVFKPITDFNRHVYLEETTAAGVSTKRKVALQPGFYDANELATALKDALNAATTLDALSYTASFNATKGNLTINNSTPNALFVIWPEERLEKSGLWNPLGLSAIPPYVDGDNCYQTIGFHGPGVIGEGAGLTGSVAVGNGHVSLVPYHSLFLHSTLGDGGDSIGPNFETTIIKRIPLTSQPGQMQHDLMAQPLDYIRVSDSNIRTMEFRLTDFRGNTVDMSHQNISFSLTFVPEAEF